MSRIVTIVGAPNDSLSFAGSGALNGWAGATSLTTGWPIQARSSLMVPVTSIYPDGNVLFCNTAYSGQNMTSALNQATATKALINANYVSGGGRPERKYILYVQIGTNPDTGVAATDAGRMRGYCLDMQSAGYYVVLCAIPSKSGQDTLNQAINAIYATWTSSDGIYAFIPPTVTELYATGAAANTTYFSDGVHPTAAGYALLQTHIGYYLERTVADLEVGPPSGAPTLSSSGVTNNYDVALAWTINGSTAGRGAIVQWRDNALGGAWLYSSTVSGASGTVTMNYPGAMTWDVRVQTFNDDGTNSSYSNTIQVNVG